MFFQLEPALAALPELGPRTREAVERLLPGPLTLVLPNPARRYPLACGPEPERLGCACRARGRARAARVGALAGAPVEREPLAAGPTPAGSRTSTPELGRAST